MNAHIDRIRKQVRDRAQEFCLDNPRLLGAELVVETAMLIGASIVLSTPIDLADESPMTPQTEELLSQLFSK